MQDFPHLQDLYIAEIDLHTIFRILRKNMGFQICIQAASILMKHWRNTGHIGAGISISIDISEPV